MSKKKGGRKKKEESKEEQKKEGRSISKCIEEPVRQFKVCMLCYPERDHKEGEVKELP